MKTVLAFAIGAIVIGAAAVGLAQSGLLGDAGKGRYGLVAQGAPKFELTAHDGRQFSSETLAGRPYALFFGFTSCPEICPTTLYEITNHMATLGPDADKLTVLFVSVDHEHDTPEMLQTYLSNFDTRILGLSGTADQIRKIAGQFDAYYSRIKTEHGYTYDHTTSVYLMDREGRLQDTFTFQDPQADQVGKLAALAAS